MSRALNGVGVAGTLSLLVAFGLGACGEGFSSEDCQSHTCPASGGEPQGGAFSQPGSGGSMESTPGGTTAADGGGGQAGVDPIPCGGPDDCDDGDAANGPEDCGQDGICVAGNPPPTVVATSPERDTTDVELTTEIVIEFSEALDPATVTAQSVQLLDGERALDGELAYGDRKVTFTPDSPLALLAPASHAAHPSGSKATKPCK